MIPTHVVSYPPGHNATLAYRTVTTSLEYRTVTTITRSEMGDPKVYAFNAHTQSMRRNEHTASTEPCAASLSERAHALAANRLRRANLAAHRRLSVHLTA